MVKDPNFTNYNKDSKDQQQSVQKIEMYLQK